MQIYSTEKELHNTWMSMYVLIFIKTHNKNIEDSKQSNQIQKTSFLQTQESTAYLARHMKHWDIRHFSEQHNEESEVLLKYPFSNWDTGCYYLHKTMQSVGVSLPINLGSVSVFFWC